MKYYYLKLKIITRLIISSIILFSLMTITIVIDFLFFLKSVLYKGNTSAIFSCIDTYKIKIYLYTNTYIFFNDTRFYQYNYVHVKH